MTLSLEIDAQVSAKDLKKKLEKIAKVEEPSFSKYVPDFERIYSFCKKYEGVNSFILIAQGGAITTFLGIWECLGKYSSTKKVFPLTSTDPDYISFVKKNCPIEQTLVVAISKSGSNVNHLEMLFAFQDYKKLIVLQDELSALAFLARKEGWDVLESPDISDRFAAMTEIALTPSSLLYMPSDQILRGYQKMKECCLPKVSIEHNPALKAATVLFLLEEKGYDEVYTLIYSQQLTAFSELIMQLMHETVCKEGKGQTFLALAAPQAQHHTNQRFFDGKGNMVGFFIRVENYQEDMKLKVKANVKDISLREKNLGILDGISLGKTLECEYLGTRQNASRLKIPNLTLTLDKISPESVGEFLAFWHYVAFYSTLLRDLEVFTQPAVEASKDISFKLRLALKNKNL